MQKSTRLFNQAKKYLVGGVNSPIRSFKAVGGNPVFIKAGKGAKIYSEEGRGFIDYCQSFGALILGHSHPRVAGALKKALGKGSAFGAPTRLETDLAKVIAQAIPSIEKIRFTNSGTEAVMGAIRTARAYTRKNKIVKFQGAYHGHADYAGHTLTVPYNDIERTEAAVRKHKKDVAAIIVEPISGNMGVVLPKDNFLQGLRSIADKFKIILIFDEVITGFRLIYGGAQNLFNIKPDLTCLGKIIGGGLPIGAFGGRKGIMNLLAPHGNVYQAGTFSGNPVSVTAGLVTLRVLSQSNPYKRLEDLTRQLCVNMKGTALGHGFKVETNFIGSMFSVFFTDKEAIDYKTVSMQNAGLFKRFYRGLLKEGVYFSPSAFEANFLSAAHTNRHIGETLRAIDKSFKNLRRN